MPLKRLELIQWRDLSDENGGVLEDSVDEWNRLVPVGQLPDDEDDCGRDLFRSSIMRHRDIFQWSHKHHNLYHGHRLAELAVTL